MQNSVIPGIARQLNTQKPCTDRLCLGRIGAGMFIPVSAKDLPAVSDIQFQYFSRKEHKQRRQPGRDKVKDIVRLRRKPPEIGIRRVLIPQHGIHGIDSFVQESKRSA